MKKRVRFLRGELFNERQNHDSWYLYESPSRLQMECLIPNLMICRLTLKNIKLIIINGARFFFGIIFDSYLQSRKRAHFKYSMRVFSLKKFKCRNLTPAAIENTKFQTQYVISREGSGVGIQMSQEKKTRTCTVNDSKIFA